MNTGPAVIVMGYASLDHAMAVEALAEPDRTAIVERRLSQPWPDIGGAAHVARAVTAPARADLVTWVGDDDPGRQYVEQVAAAGVGTAGIATALARTPSSYLFYDRAGQAACFFDPGGSVSALTAAQVDAVARCDWLCVTVGPPDATAHALDVLPDAAALAWVVKADRTAFDDALVRRCLQRAALVVFSRGERTFLDEQIAPDDALALVSGDCVLVETRGSEQIWFRCGGSEGVVEVEPVAAGDTTGAGDTFAARLLTAIAAGAQPRDAVRDAAGAARALLLDRQRKAGA